MSSVLQKRVEIAGVSLKQSYIAKESLNNCPKGRNPGKYYFLKNLRGSDMISGSKGQKAVRACTIRLLNLGPVKHGESGFRMFMISNEGQNTF